MTGGVGAYERDPYLRELGTRVVSTADDGRPFVVLEDTVLYPEGGGQPCDRGSIGETAVLEVRRVDDEIRHYVDSPPAETSVRVVLDWERRYDHMQQHTAQHLLSALFLRQHGWATTSFHLGERGCDIELDTPSIEPPVLAEIEVEFMEKVRSALAITARRVSADEYRAMAIRGRGLPADHEGSVRLVEIEGADKTTCGGTHLGSTAEIESIHLGPVERMRGGSRLYWIAGGRVRRRLRELEGRVAELKTLFETSEEDLLATAGTRQAALQQTTRELRHQTSRLAEASAKALAASAEALLEAHFDGADGRFLADVGRAFVAHGGNQVVLLTASTGDGQFFLICNGGQSGFDLAQAGPEVAAILGGRGGGSGTTFQGKAASLEQREEAVRALRRFVGE